MSAPQEPAKPPIPSATVLLLRDGATGLEVFMVKRHREVDFASGALVFPGGKVDPDDTDPDLMARAAESFEGDPLELPFRIAAVREVFEECGILLCRRRGSKALIDAAALAPIAKKYRDAMNSRQIGFAAMARTEDLFPACDLMTPFARWVTPTNLPKRFDTWFYLAVAPSDQLGLHDGREAVDSLWCAPAHVVAEADAQRATVVFATRMNLIKLGRAASVHEALANAQAEQIVTVMPVLAKTAAGPVLRIPLSAGYGVEEVAVTGIPKP